MYVARARLSDRPAVIWQCLRSQRPEERPEERFEDQPAMINQLQDYDKNIKMSIVRFPPAATSSIIQNQPGRAIITPIRSSKIQHHVQDSDRPGTSRQADDDVRPATSSQAKPTELRAIYQPPCLLCREELAHIIHASSTVQFATDYLAPGHAIEECYRA